VGSIPYYGLPCFCYFGISYDLCLVISLIMDLNLFEVFYTNIIEALKVGIMLGFFVGLSVMIFRRRRSMIY